MNAAPTLPIKPEMPTSATPAALQRDDSQSAPSFMATLQKVKSDKPQPPSDENQPDPSPTLTGEDQTASTHNGEEPLEMDTAKPQAVVLIESPAELFPGGSTMEGMEPAIDEGGATGAETPVLGANGITPHEERAVDRPSDLKTADGPVRTRPSGIPPTSSQIQLKNPAPVVLTPPEPENVNQDPDMATPQSPSRETFGKTFAPNDPGVAGEAGNSGARVPGAGEKGRPPTSGPPVTAANRIPAQAATGPHGPLTGDIETIQHPSEAVRPTMAPVTKPTDAADRQTVLAMPAAATNPTATPGREPGNAASETYESTLSGRLAVENTGRHDGPGLSADGENSEDQPRRWLAAEQTLETVRNDRTGRLEAGTRADWLAPVERQEMTPLNKPSQPIFAEKSPAPAGESFRSQNLDPIVERIAVSVRGNQSEARIALKPDHLGSIRLQIATDNGIVNIKIMAEFPMARDLLEAHLPQLKADLQQQGLDLEEFNVTLDNEEQHFRRGDRRQQGAFRPPSGSARHNAPSDQPDHERPDNEMSNRRSSSTGVDFFA